MVFYAHSDYWYGAYVYRQSRTELRDVLDPQEVYGSDFPWGGGTFRVLTKSPSFGGMEKELKAYGDAAQSDEETRVGEVGCGQRTLNRTSGQNRMADAAHSTAMR